MVDSGELPNELVSAFQKKPSFEGMLAERTDVRQKF